MESTLHFSNAQYRKLGIFQNVPKVREAQHRPVFIGENKLGASKRGMREKVPFTRLLGERQEEGLSPARTGDNTTHACRPEGGNQSMRKTL